MEFSNYLNTFLHHPLAYRIWTFPIGLLPVKLLTFFDWGKRDATSSSFYLLIRWLEGVVRKVFENVIKTESWEIVLAQYFTENARQSGEGKSQHT